MHLAGTLLGFVLALLLVSTTPVGTGAGTHQFDLLHPLFSHVHIVNGRVFTHEEMAQQAPVPRPQTAPGPTFGAGTGASSDAGGPGLSPTLPQLTIAAVSVMPAGWPPTDLPLPTGRDEAPPDPPPVA
jgi:hypothetical protein